MTPADPPDPDLAETRLVPMTEDVARHLLDVLVVPWQASWDDYDWDRHREVIIWFRKHWPELFAAHEAWHWVEASYEKYPPIEEGKEPTYGEEEG